SSAGGDDRGSVGGLCAWTRGAAGEGQLVSRRGHRPLYLLRIGVVASRLHVAGADRVIFLRRPERRVFRGSDLEHSIHLVRPDIELAELADMDCLVYSAVF